MADSCSPNMVVATETSLRPDQADEEIGDAVNFKKVYKIHRRDREIGRVGGGVFVAVYIELKRTRQEDLGETRTVNRHGLKLIFRAQSHHTFEGCGREWGPYRPNERDTQSERQLRDYLHDAGNGLKDPTAPISS